MNRLLRMYGLVIVESAICFFGMKDISITDAWAHPFRVFIVLVMLIVISLVWTILGSIAEYKQQRKNLLNKKHEKRKPGEKAA